MKAIDIPKLVQLPWADGAGPTFINSIPTPSQIGITTGLASLTDGFPPVTFLDEGAGGQPPFGADFNGILNLISGNTRWGNAGSFYPFDLTFSTYIGGYPIGAVLVRADGTGFWLSTMDDNTNNPESSSTGWFPVNNAGATTITGLTNTNVTLTTLQYSKDLIILSGTLTGNVQIIFPAIVKNWEIINNTTGAFTVTAKTSSGTGVAINQTGIPNPVTGDGTNILAGVDLSNVLTSASFTQSAPTLAVGASGAALGTIGVEGWERQPNGLIKKWVTIQIQDGTPTTWTYKTSGGAPAFVTGVTKLNFINLAQAAGQSGGSTVGRLSVPSLPGKTSAALNGNATGTGGSLFWVLVEIEGY